MFDPSTFAQRRQRFFAQLGEAAAVIPAAALVTHHADCEWPFRQNSDFWYLTGFDEPEAVALFLPHRPEGERYVLFVQPREASAEVWNGFRWGTEGAVAEFGADLAHPRSELEQRLPDYLRGAEGIAFRVGKHPKVEPLVLAAWAAQLDRAPRSGRAALGLVAPCPLLHELRLRKGPEELERMREAARISAEAHELARQVVRPGLNERQVQAVIEQHFLEQGARGPAYGTIVAGGDNACVLHYIANNAPLNDGDLLLIDAGCSLADYYNGDITRSFPINGRFSGEQRALYELVLAAQEAAVASVAPGFSAEGVHETALRVLVAGLLDLGLLAGSLDGVIEQGAYRHLYMHRTGHWLGLDVHDVGAYRLGEHHVELEPGMVLTVEPGLYVSDRLPVPEGQPEIEARWKGIGIRIEDDVAVTSHGHENLTAAALKSPAALER
ncbi:MAG: aminopeptidase P N-terminal domain-containing protein [Prochlorococcaceae cyanobacterium MAG_34]|jgi:Xaa-Pro aminopeptidase|uniref:aminopeptidase P N-terminal domain-containing protein n=2 Tax=Cyanobium TaxID=167375 RepID=UPI0007159352|nr:aminopeptidase P N-terminal domain-containing protein [Cyanobium usitatum]KRO91499.1 MAG: peptidase M24 [cyanobacterium BACL30 MAG-120619-bin27]MDP4681912.1 aminopeptidase P N-terminal domain-containing protein [Cyanobium sp. MAG_255]MDP4809235.1 aminopeptidase P N-terminal domain-containing protein [Cyanobium sp. MAG_160]MDP4880845.1 aminopeptidase P N-terminal domain-containing protein [Cyanobium sp. MAG_137]MDP4946955.1 aminopeptidase P N-terminal domain-containing protein [Cyanobium sp.